MFSFSFYFFFSFFSSFLLLYQVGSRVHTGKTDQYEWYAIQRPLIWHKWGLSGCLFYSNPDLLPYAPADAAVVLVLL